ncbi:hypothetical protein [Hyalangium minutum]|uniref:Uncharacterized protein n=1 Tax=Hyalangium minutum TaxID=394096 RepID=A0A085WQD7_9BACT|nr:hypothetical protein [Hyalangium minutum]KFE69900.1 hypothetical protein DB31_4942 [Hyalangium minutum]
MQSQKPQAPQAAPKPGTPSRKVLVDGNTVELAKKLGLSVEEYLDRVVRFFLHPPQEPALSVVAAPEPQPPVRREPPEPRAAAESPPLRSASHRKTG